MKINYHVREARCLVPRVIYSGNVSNMDVTYVIYVVITAVSMVIGAKRF